MPKLTKRLIESTSPSTQDIILRDSDIKGFQCKITPKGKRSYLLYYRTKEGKERRPKIGMHGNITCEQAREIAKEWSAIIAQGGDPSGDTQSLKKALTVAELGELYLEYKKAYLKEKSWKETRRLWDKEIIPAIGSIKLTQLTVADVQALHKRRASRPYQANRTLVAISSSISYAMEQKLAPLKENPCKAIKKYPEKARETYLSQEEIDRLFALLDECDRNRTEMPSITNLIRLLLFTGCRLSEIRTLKWSYIDWDNQCLKLPDSKTGAKTVYVALEVIDILRSIEEVEGNPYVLVGRKTGEPIISPQKSWERIRKKAQLEHLRIHDLRHSFASIGAGNGLSLPIIGALMGHKNPQTTARYAHLIGEPLHQAAAAIGESIREAAE